MMVERIAGYHRQSYGGCKVGVGDVLIGATALAAEYNGVEKASHIKDKLIEMTHLNETLYACGIACSAEGHKTESGNYIIDLLLNFMTWLLYAGFVVFVLRMIRQQRNSLWNLMDGFQNFLKIIGLNILTGIFVALWSLLFVIPGIIAAYRYRQALYLLLDHPEMGVLECIRESKRLMRGHKAELFILDLSFIGWALLSIIPFVSVYTLPYTESTYALYYSMLREQDAAPGPDRGPDPGAWYNN